MKSVKKQLGGAGRSLKSDMIEPNKEIKFGGVKKYSGGGYPVYAKGSKQSKSFQEAFGKAGRSGKSTFEWEGRKYGTRLAGESNDAYKARMAKNSAGTTRAASGKGPSQIAGGASSERSLATGPRPTLVASSSKKSAATKREERSNERKGNRAERRKEQPKVMKSTSNAKAIDKLLPKAGTKISTNTNPSSYMQKRSSGMSMSQLGGKEVDMSAMKSSGTSKSQPASKPTSGRVGRLEERAKRARERNANRDKRQSSKSSKREAVKSAKANLKAARRG